MRLPNSAHFDLHMHTDRSDGKFPAEEVIHRCAAGGLDVVSLTDHDLVTEADLAGEHLIGGQRIRVLGGAEVSGSHDGKEYHLLAYFPGPVPTAFVEFCRAQSQERARRYEKAVHTLGLDGLELADHDAHSGDRALTRYHLAQALVNAGHAADTADAFKRFLSHSHGNVPRLELAFVDAIKIIRQFGGVTSWAHPPLDSLRKYLPTFVEAGLQGLEGVRPFLTSSDRKQIGKAARKHGLFLTGGSDWHGWRDGELGLFYIERQRLEGFIGALQAA